MLERKQERKQVCMELVGMQERKLVRKLEHKQAYILVVGTQVCKVLVVDKLVCIPVVGK